MQAAKEEEYKRTRSLVIERSFVVIENRENHNILNQVEQDRKIKEKHRDAKEIVLNMSSEQRLF